MLDIGFRPDIEKILRRCPKDRQTLLLSATVPPPIERLAKRYMVNPEKLDFSPGDATVDTIDQYYFTVDTELKFDLLLRLIEREEPKQAIVFCRTKRRTDQVARRLGKKLKRHPAGSRLGFAEARGVRARLVQPRQAARLSDGAPIRSPGDWERNSRAWAPFTAI